MEVEFILTIVTSTIAFFAAFRILIAICKLFGFDEDQRIQIPSYSLSLVHCLVVCYFTAVDIYDNSDKLTDIGSSLRTSNSRLFRYTSSFLVGYFIYDFIAIMMHPIIFSKLFVVHHVFAFFGGMIGALGNYQWLTMPFYFGEIPVIFIDLMTLNKLLYLGIPSTLLELLSGSTFVLFRLTLIPTEIFIYAKYCVLSDNCSTGHDIQLYGLLPIFITISSLNVYWFYLAISGGKARSTDAVLEKEKRTN